MKKIMLSILMGLILVGCGQQKTNQNKDNQVSIANPFHEYEKLEDAFADTGLAFNAPDQIGSYTIDKIRAIPSELLEIIYANENDYIKIRKTKGNEDNSGNYSAEVYDCTTMKYQGIELNLSSQENKVFIAYWSLNNESYSISSDLGISNEFLLEIIDTITK